MALTFTAIALVGPAVSSRAAAQVPCTLCEDTPPEWANYVVTGQHSPITCGGARGERQSSVGQPSDDSAPWERDARWVAAVAFQHVPREMAGEPSAEPLLDEVRVVHETDTEAIVMGGRSEDPDYRICLVRPWRQSRWLTLRIESVDRGRNLR
jgi:hypothetical protein